MKKILEAINGKKTYLISGATILYCVLGVGLHFMTLPAALGFIGTAGSIAALRNGVSKVAGILEIVLEILKIIGGGAAAIETETTVTQTTTVAPTTTDTTTPEQK